jgi:deoxyhypusine synthase
MSDKGILRAKHKLHDGFSDGLEPVEVIDVTRTDTVDQLVRAMSKTAFTARTLGEAVDVFVEMISDPHCFVVGTFSGAMTVAKQGLLLCEMMDRGWLHAIVSTGALMAHGFVEGMGRTHFKYRPDMDDCELYDKGYDRVYDTLELEQNLDDAEVIVRQVLTQWPAGKNLCSHALLYELGKHLDKTLPRSQRAILRSAYRNGVPVFVPAFSDSELGLDVAIFRRKQRMEGAQPLVFDPFLDLERFAALVHDQRRLGIFTIGGGVPRNWAQQIGPFFEITKKRLGVEVNLQRYHYAVRICPEPVNWGGLSGCTYSEGVSWGKFVPPHEGGRFAEVLLDATVGWPLLVRAALERTGKKHPRAKRSATARARSRRS